MDSYLPSLSWSGKGLMERGSHFIDDAQGCLAGLSLFHSFSGKASTWSTQE